jgi:hypothetical protein
MTKLIPNLVPYVCGSANYSSLLHQCCACHIINLIVKSGLKHIKEARRNLMIFVELFPSLILLTIAF